MAYGYSPRSSRQLAMDLRRDVVLRLRPAKPPMAHGYSPCSSRQLAMDLWRDVVLRLEQPH